MDGKKGIVGGDHRCREDDYWAGLDGSKGLKGSIGLKGLKGETGTSGLIGFQGLTGMKGYEGPAGPKGPEGEIGEIGTCSEIGICSLGLGHCYGSSSTSLTVTCDEQYAATAIWRNSHSFGL